jgi:hypothetical protein
MLNFLGRLYWIFINNVGEINLLLAILNYGHYLITDIARNVEFYSGRCTQRPYRYCCNASAQRSPSMAAETMPPA